LSMHSDEAHRRAEALFKKKQQAHEGREAMVECQAQLDDRQSDNPIEGACT